MSATPVTVWESLQTQGVAVQGAIVFIDPDTLQPTLDDSGLHYDVTNQEFQAKKIATDISLAGVNGDVTLNASVAQVSFAAAAQTLTLTNSYIEADSLLICTVATDDLTAFAAKGIVTAAGTATIKLNAAATGVTKVNILVVRKK